MNERDKELNEQAEKYADVHFKGEGGAVWVEAFESKFADLIRADERERIKAVNAPEIERINYHIKDLEDRIRARENT